MKLSDLKENDQQLDELLPAIGQAVGGIARGAAAVGGKIAQGVKAVGSAVGQAAQGFQAGLAGGGMDPAQAAQAKKDRDEQKKQIQDQITQTEQQLSDLRKQLAQLG